MYITIVGSRRYLGVENYRIGQELYLKKDVDNRYDDEAIKVESESDTTCGYVANSVNTVARGTHSAGYIYKELNKNAKCRVAFIINDSVIAEIIK